MTEQLKEAITQETAAILIQGKHTFRPTGVTDFQPVVSHHMYSVLSRRQARGSG